MIEILWLWTAHTIGDFFAQTDWIAVNKSKRLDALLQHVLVYSTIVFIATGGNLTFGAITFVAHFCTDWATSRISRRQFPFIATDNKSFLLDADGSYSTDPIFIPAGLGPMLPVYLKRSRHWFFCTIGVDQWLHMAQLTLTAYYLGWGVVNGTR